jgi:hypothetical protein
MDERGQSRLAVRAAALCKSTLTPFIFAACALGADAATFADLEAQGLRIGEVRIHAENIFDLADPAENNWLFRLANSLHVGTRPEVIRRSILFKSGDPVSARVIEESERLLHANRFLYEAAIRPGAVHDGVVDVDVITRDTWTIDLTGKYSRTGGENSSKFGIRDTNLAGTALTLGFSQTSDPDRSGWEFETTYPKAFDGWTQLSYMQGSYDDGSTRKASVVRPFYALDTRWAYSIAYDKFDRVDSIYNAGDVVSAYRHGSKGFEAWGGWSPGLVNGWTQRFSAGVTARDEAYAIEPGEVPLVPLPIDHKLRGPFVAYEVVEDRFKRTRNRDQIARTEFVEMGFNSRLQLTRTLEGWGATRSAWLYSAIASYGYAFPRGHDLLAKLTLERGLDSRGETLDHQGMSLRYYAPQSARAAFYGLLELDRIGTAAAPDQLSIGGDTGLRAYPLRYQHGEQRALMTLEQRYYTDWYPFRLFRVGGAVFFDAGRAWKGVNQNTANGGWLSDAGVGLRISLDRTAFANVLHIDAAVPFDREPGIKAVEFSVKTQLTF